MLQAGQLMSCFIQQMQPFRWYSRLNLSPLWC